MCATGPPKDARPSLRNAARTSRALPAFFKGDGGSADQPLHPHLDAVLRGLLHEELVDAGILVRVFDLVAALLDARGHAAEERGALSLREGIAQRAVRRREIARWHRTRVEVLVEHRIGRREYRAVLPVHLHEVLL